MGGKVSNVTAYKSKSTHFMLSITTNNISDFCLAGLLFSIINASRLGTEAFLQCGLPQVFYKLLVQGGPKKTDPQFYFWDNFGNSAPILTILSLLQAEIYGA